MAHTAYHLLTKILRRLEETDGHEEHHHEEEAPHYDEDHAGGDALLGAKIGLIFGIGEFSNGGEEKVLKKLSVVELSALTRLVSNQNEHAI